MNKKLKKYIEPLYHGLSENPFTRTVLYHAGEGYFTLRTLLMGKAHPSAEEIADIEKNVTFIYKSFNRQKCARKLYRSIKQYYPGARVVIADDSRVPLTIDSLREGDTIIHLPFNSGLSRGLDAALQRVGTPYVIRMDDDLLLTPGSHFYSQLQFLQTHPEVDLAAIQMQSRHPEKAARRYASVRMNRPLLIPAGTWIDGRMVVYKAPNVYMARTESLRKVGFDPNIRMIDHHEFFYRAAGQIVCVQDPHSYVMHCHNRFEGKEYTPYRHAYAQDLRYIAAKHGEAYWEDEEAPSTVSKS